ncbi:AraC family transcriptional regulator [Tardiphaga sp. 804_B3_N1_9]|uniref:AraC family transcriptional regulator n=1 Tax=Tardiphaga TaxID=1395974 RepID=UPI0030B8E702
MTETIREIADIIARYAANGSDHPTGLASLYLKRQTEPTQLVHTAQWPCFGLVAQGAKRLQLGTETYTYAAGDYVLVSLDLPMSSCIVEASEAQPHLGMGFAIDPQLLKEVLGRFGNGHADAPAHPQLPERGVVVAKSSADLLDATLRLLRLLDRPQDIPVMAPLLEQEVLYRLLVGPYGARLRQIALAESPSNKVAKAISWLRSNYASPLRIEDLADRVGMSESSLHHNFKTVTAMTPMQYQKQLRLHEARRLMLVERLDVGSAGYAVGYQSPSQFSREYARLYGQPPIRDVGSARGPVLGGEARVAG